MSNETITWLNENTLVGFTDKRGEAWHYREGSDNHYPGAIPVGEVQRRLFNFDVLEADIFFENAKTGKMVGAPGKKLYYRSDNGRVMGMHADTHNAMAYGDWLISRLSNLLQDTLRIGSAGLLRGGSQAWVQVELENNVDTPEGVTFRPNLLAATSFDGSIANTYMRTATIVVCDNTLAMGLGEKHKQKIRVKHTAHANERMATAESHLDMQQALGLVQTGADLFSAEIKRLAEMTVTDRQLTAFLDSYNPIPQDEGKGKTIASKKRDVLMTLYNNDNRVSPWRGTGFGVLQMTNTYDHHMNQQSKTKTRAERNMANVLIGSRQRSDTATVELLEKVLVSA